MRLVWNIIVLLFFTSLVEAQVKREYLFDSFMDGKSVLFTGDSLNIWGFQRLLPDTSLKLLPSPTIYCELGDTVEIQMINTSVEGHTIHLHGLDVDQANDGVPATSFFIQPGQTGTYSFVATHVGNYLYHCHVTSVMHVQLGMYGMLVVANPGGIKEIYPGGQKYEKEYAWLGAEIDKSWHDDYTTIGGFMNFFPDYFQISGKAKNRLWEDSSISIYEARVGEPILLRVLNIGFGIQEYVFPSLVTVKAMMSDGRVLPSEVQLDTLAVYPGERYGLIMWPGALGVDSIQVNFRSMLRGLLWAQESIPLEVSGFYGLEKSSNNQIGIFPNPNNGNFTVVPKIEIQRLELVDVNGRIMWSEEYDEAIMARKINVVLPEIESGVYFLRAKSPKDLLISRITIHP